MIYSHCKLCCAVQPLDVVMKFGGSSLADKDRIDHVAHLIQSQLQNGFRPRAVVCSAMGKTTNSLLSAGEFALGELSISCETSRVESR
jgi:aspartate kinase